MPLLSVPRLVLKLVVVVVLLAGVLPAWALDAKKGAMNLAKSAAASYEAGDMARAAQLYLEAYRIDHDESTYLYGAARAEQAAGQFDRAEEHFRQFVALKSADSDRVNRAVGFLDELAGMRSDQKAEAAERFARRGEWMLAVAAYKEASRLRPDRVFLLYRAAVASHEGGDKKQALEFLQRYLTQAPSGAPDRAEAQLLQDTLTGKAKETEPKHATPQPEPRKTAPAPEATTPTPAATTPAPAASTPAPVAEPTKNKPPAADAWPGMPDHAAAMRKEAPGMTARELAGWTTLGGGALVAVVGGIVLGVAKAQAGTFADNLGYDGTRTHTSMTYDEAVAEASAISGRQTAGAVMLGTGAVAAGVGAVMLLTAPSRAVAVATDGKTVVLGWRF